VEKLLSAVWRKAAAGSEGRNDGSSILLPRIKGEGIISPVSDPPGKLLPQGGSARNPKESPTPTEPTDEMLMERFRDGDSHAFEELYRRHAAPLHGFLRRMVRSNAAASDLVQVAFLHVVKARGRYAQGERFPPWLYSIAHNAARDYQRLAHHRHEAPEEDDGPEPVSDSEPVAGADPAEVQALKRALDELPEAYREAVVLHQIEGMSFPEIAKAVGSTTGAVKVRAHRGYTRLRAALESWKRGRQS
jgi:RNA polymerase sigma-70 factor (ECF subfamily)